RPGRGAAARRAPPPDLDRGRAPGQVARALPPVLAGGRDPGREPEVVRADPQALGHRAGGGRGVQLDLGLQAPDREPADRLHPHHHRPWRRHHPPAPPGRLRRPAPGAYRLPRRHRPVAGDHGRGAALRYLGAQLRHPGVHVPYRRDRRGVPARLRAAQRPPLRGRHPGHRRGHRREAGGQVPVLAQAAADRPPGRRLDVGLVRNRTKREQTMSKRSAGRTGTTFRLLATGVVAALALAACGRGPAGEAATADGPAAPVYFDWFEYTGHDAAFEAPLPEGHFRNPVLAGFHSDPSVTAANGKFYLVASTFAFFPGIPVFESEDLVHWEQVGSAIHRPGQLDVDGLGMSRGVFAPAIEYHDGTFYVVNTSVDAGGNFFVAAKDPAGPWSDPVWLPTIGGIDPSLFFDDDGKVYILNNDEPEVPVRYDGHRAIWLQEIDIASGKPFGPRKVLIDGG